MSTVLDHPAERARLWSHAAVAAVTVFAILGCPAAPHPPKTATDDRPADPRPATAARPSTLAPPTVTPPPIRKDGTMFGTSELMGTTVSINVYVGPSGDASGAGAAMEAALAEMARIEELMSEWKPHSELSRLNTSAGAAPMPISAELYEVLTRAAIVSEQTDGTFDVTFHGVGQLWSFKPGATPPSPQAIAAALPRVDWSKVVLDEAKTTAALGPEMKIGLGAIAKGYAVDRASKVLLERGFSNHVVEAGGDTYAAGDKGGTPWRVGVKDPEGAGSVGVLSIRARAVVTSGDYMRFFEHQGRRYAHILDPRTGWPVRRSASPKSVTLLATNATDADAYCTAVTVMGPAAGLAFVESRPDLEAVIIERDGTVRVSTGLTEVYTALPPLTPEL